MPNTLPDVVATSSCTGFCDALSSELDPRILLQIPDALGEKTCCHEI